MKAPIWNAPTSDVAVRMAELIRKDFGARTSTKGKVVLVRGEGNHWRSRIPGLVAKLSMK